ncbi:ribonuclease H2 subunit C [Amblyraja radiata]|uniref:ribonuclease H2 subunit C n=1 Tax=Amblyraja radiata TaxID=386614 RepID=UPI001403362A|nr:ribonuclease H2 subunit C [Amblyraja radiata]
MAGGGSAPVIRVDVRALRELPRDRVHLLPVSIESDGQASVDQYFTPAIHDCGGEMEVSFRGRALRGRELPVPDGFVGLVLKEDQRPCSDGEERALRVKSAFDSLTYWNLESRPTMDDRVAMAMGWPLLAQAIHAAVGE